MRVMPAFPPGQRSSKQKLGNTNCLFYLYQNQFFKKMGIIYTTRNNIRLLFSLLFLFSLFTGYSQHIEKEKKDPNRFDEAAALEKAKAKGIKPTEISGYIQTQKQKFSSQKSLEKQHKHSPYEGGIPAQQRVIYVSPNSPMSVGCPNAGFEQYDFTNWTGENGDYSGDATNVTYNLNPGIIDAAGPNI